MSIDFAKDTSVSVARTRSQIMELLERAGCTGLAFVQEDKQHAIQFKLHGRLYQFRVVYAPWVKFTNELDRYGRRVKESVARNRYEQHQRTRWRALWLLTKALLVQVELEYMSVEEAFLPHLMLPSGQTVVETFAPRIDELQTRDMVRLLPVPGGRHE